MDYLLLLAFMAITSTATLAGSVKIINQGDEALVEFLGKYDGKKLEPGLNFITPFLSNVVYKETTREKVLEITPQTCITRDNVSISVDAVVYWRVIDIEKAYYKVQNLQSAIVNLVLTQIRAEIGNLQLNETLTARTTINKTLLRELDTATEPWGVKVTRVELREIVPSKTVQGAMELQMSAERKKQAAILSSEGEREAAVNAARGEAEAQLIEAEARQKAAILEAEAQQKQQILKAQATAAAMEIIGKKLNTDANAGRALQFLLAQNYLEMGMKIGSSGSSKVMFVDPRSIPSTLEGIGSIVEESNNGTVKQVS